jgi:tRNA A37 methylthiotransferase MiaB
MGRDYQVEEFKDVVVKFREAVPDLTLSTDVITGFPGESEEDHLKTVELLETLRPNIVNITRFSERPGTPAVELPGKVHGRTSKARSRELTELCQKISLKLNKELIGTTRQVLATERNIGQYQDTTLARTPSYRPVVIDRELQLGKFYQVRIESVTEAYLRGKLI